jgi:hypothetical protein
MNSDEMAPDPIDEEVARINARNFDIPEDEIAQDSGEEQNNSEAEADEEEPE